MCLLCHQQLKKKEEVVSCRILKIGKKKNIVPSGKSGLPGYRLGMFFSGAPCILSNHFHICARRNPSPDYRCPLSICLMV
jgi:hypothetical protein